MAWTPGKSWSTGEVLTVWKVQTHWTDQLLSARNLWDNACKVHGSSAPNFEISEANKYHIVPWRNVTWQVGGGIFSTAEPTKFLAPLAGWYELIPTIVWSTSSGGNRFQGYQLNGASPQYDQHTLQTNNNSFHPGTNALDYVQMTTVDYLEVVVKHNGAEDDIKIIMTDFGSNTRCSWRLVGAAS